MASNRIFLGCRNGFVVGALADTTTGEALAINLEYESAQEKSAQIEREALLGATVDSLNEINFEEAGVIEVFVYDSLFKAINKGFYKYWVANGGLKNDGEPVDETELSLWSEFNEVMKNHGHQIIFRNLYEANWKDENGKITAKYDLDNVNFNQTYYDWIVATLDKVAPIEKTKKSTGFRKGIAKANLPA